MRRNSTIHDIVPQEIRRIAEDVYIYGYPLLVMDVMKRTQTATAYASSREAPVNQFAHCRRLPEPTDKCGLHPTPDSVHSSAWLDLRKEPVVLTIPRLARYFLFSCFSAWYEIFETFSPRNAGAEAGHFAFVGPRFCGKLPPGVKRIFSPTEIVWIDGLLAVGPSEDMQLVHTVQDQFRLTPLGQWHHSSLEDTFRSVPFPLNVDHKSSAQEQVGRMDAREFFTRFSRLLQRNPGQIYDSDMISEFMRIGFFPGDDFCFEMLPANVTDAMHRAVPAGQSKIVKAGKPDPGSGFLNGWQEHVHPGRYRSHYLERAAAAHAGNPGALAEDVMCFHTGVDQNGETFDGANQYAIQFHRGFAPPVNGFWSITLSDARQHLVANNLHRYVIGDANRLRLNLDSSLSICIQHDWPGAGLDTNWLPAPKDAFNLVFRLYWPKPDALSGRWRPPAVVRTH